jgi:hypothetical protein
MNKLRRSVRVGAAALALAAGATPVAMAASATPAAAASTVSGCTTSFRINAAGFNEATALCTQGSGTYRVAVFFPIFSLSSIAPPLTGPIVQVGQPSTVTYGNGSGQVVRILGAPYVEKIS